MDRNDTLTQDEVIDNVWKYRNSRSDITHKRGLRSTRDNSETVHEKSTVATRYSEPTNPLSVASTANRQEKFEIEFARETPEERLLRNRKFYNNRPLMWALDSDGGIMKSYVDDLLFNKLFDEVQHNVEEMGLVQVRSLESARSFWDNVRNQVKGDESEQEDFESDPRTEEQFVPVVTTRQADRKSKAATWFKNGKDPYLQQVRDSLFSAPKERSSSQVEFGISLTEP